MQFVATFSLVSRLLSLDSQDCGWAFPRGDIVRYLLGIGSAETSLLQKEKWCQGQGPPNFFQSRKELSKQLLEENAALFLNFSLVDAVTRVNMLLKHVTLMHLIHRFSCATAGCYI